MFLSQGTEIPEGCNLETIGFEIVLSLQVIIPTLIGVLLPLIATKLKLDPAVLQVQI